MVEETMKRSLKLSQQQQIDERDTGLKGQGHDH